MTLGDRERSLPNVPVESASYFDEPRLDSRAMRRRETVPRASQAGIEMQVSSLTGLLGRTASIKLTAASSKNRLDQFFRLTAVSSYIRIELSLRFLQGYKR